MLKKITSFCWLLLLFFSSCYYENQALKGNKSFKKKFAKEIKSINKDRISQNKSDTMATNFETPYAQFYFPQDENELTFDYYIGSVYFGQPFPERSFPYYENYQFEQGLASDPNRIFEISYNSTGSKPFHRIGLEFDSINVPVADKYGVPIDDNNKNYLFSQNSALQENISNIKKQQNTAQNVISQKLIEEKRELLYQNQIKEYLKKDQLLEENPFYAIDKQGINANRYKKAKYFNNIISKEETSTEEKKSQLDATKTQSTATENKNN